MFWAALGSQEPTHEAEGAVNMTAARTITKMIQMQVTQALRTLEVSKRVLFPERPAITPKRPKQNWST